MARICKDSDFSGGKKTISPFLLGFLMSRIEVTIYPLAPLSFFGWYRTQWRCPIHGGYPQFSYFRIFHEINHPFYQPWSIPLKSSMWICRIFHEINHPCVGTPHIHPYPTGPTAQQAASISCVVVGVIASSEILPQAILVPVESWILGSWSKSIELYGTVVVEFRS